ncbi:hypothetical protein [Flavobacterium reichenbachii]|uniref:Uncharacterized protein n=1 Tax=Flavobacterium reichenbachii TaxID=362418 RepID=A0A085ZR40_9FLAO|nr:hypothetical protein [Flavobacterium reichenbachii]KFF06904.1 hypothetical protein IW19_15915 [Flavobacterium reichenbachii]OXB18500.1 hypothetical protein B0A68_00320 [Flavobacterium reichenbachii]
MEDSIKRTFKLNCELVEYINEMDLENLKTHFEINAAVFEEIQEELFEYFETKDLPKLKILETHFSIFKYDSIEGFGIEAKLFTANDKETELTLHTEFDNNQLRFKLIEVM